MDINDLRGLSTIFVFVSFIGLVIWAYSDRQKLEFDEASRLPFEDDKKDLADAQESDHE
ncbi:cbb3-type cytochrome oxidase subunit 3 [Porticoccaceae bacterium nBUS_17]|tara:strand:+ start:759 stop:935 length:177 start_codon:yes stop_codon:yes gene_type:complete